VRAVSATAAASGSRTSGTLALAFDNPSGDLAPAELADGWTIGSGIGDRRVCRYLDTGAGAIDANIAHPGEHADVDRALVAQNFLVVAGRRKLPARSADGAASAVNDIHPAEAAPSRHA
jgi:hypothetical protein